MAASDQYTSLASLSALGVVPAGSLISSFTATYGAPLSASGSATFTVLGIPVTFDINTISSATVGGVTTYTVSGPETLLVGIPNPLITVSISYTGQNPSTFTSASVNGLNLGVFQSTSGTITASPPCLASGTLVRTALGDVAVETLQVGDLVVTSSGEHRPIRWLGHRKVVCRHFRPGEVHPVRISKDAFGEGRPSRDLLVSPGHSICVNVVNEVLIPAIALVNGQTVQQIEVDEITYWHVELDSHDVLFAENLPAESYLNMGNRTFFQDAEIVNLASGPDGDLSLVTHADFCRPFHVGGPVVEAVRDQLCSRAKDKGWTLTHDLDLHLVVDGKRIDPVVRDLAARFHVPAEASDVWLVSPTARPSDTMGIWDERDLGVYIASMRIEDGLSSPRDVAIDDPLLCVGFHAFEDGAYRWTAGRAKLPRQLWQGFEHGFYLKVGLVSTPVPRWVQLHEASAVRAIPKLALVA